MRHSTYRSERVKALTESIADVVAKEVSLPLASTSQQLDN
jgi:hypothetical protein